MKTLFDWICALLGMIFLSLPLILIAMLIKSTMPGPIFFLQQRIGKHGKSFRLIKFRTMKVASDKASGSFDAGDTSRITPLGGFLRKYKLDEFPQLMNVLKGDMSLVGPRPEVKLWTEVYPEKWIIVHQVKPGITDNASIEFRNEEELLRKSKDPVTTYKNEILPRKLDIYIDYVQSRTFWGDILIILKTFKAL